MEFLVHMTDKRGRGKIKFVEAENTKHAERKAKEKYHSYTVGRITSDADEIEYYIRFKRNKGS